MTGNVNIAGALHAVDSKGIVAYTDDIYDYYVDSEEIKQESLRSINNRLLDFINSISNTTINGVSFVPGGNIWLAYLEGDEKIYKLTSNKDVPQIPTTGTGKSSEDRFVPTGWSSNILTVDSNNPYMWASIRNKVNDVWEEFHTPVLINSKDSYYTSTQISNFLNSKLDKYTDSGENVISTLSSAPQNNDKIPSLALFNAELDIRKRIVTSKIDGYYTFHSAENPNSINTLLLPGNSNNLFNDGEVPHGSTLKFDKADNYYLTLGALWKVLGKIIKDPITDIYSATLDNLDNPVSLRALYNILYGQSYLYGNADFSTGVLNNLEPSKVEVNIYTIPFNELAIALTPDTVTSTLKMTENIYSDHENGIPYIVYGVKNGIYYKPTSEEFYEEATSIKNAIFTIVIENTQYKLKLSSNEQKLDLEKSSIIDTSSYTKTTIIDFEANSSGDYHFYDEAEYSSTGKYTDLSKAKLKELLLDNSNEILLLDLDNSSLYTYNYITLETHTFKGDTSKNDCSKLVFSGLSQDNKLTVCEVWIARRLDKVEMTKTSYDIINNKVNTYTNSGGLITSVPATLDTNNNVNLSSLFDGYLNVGKQVQDISNAILGNSDYTNTEYPLSIWDIDSNGLTTSDIEAINTWKENFVNVVRRTLVRADKLYNSDLGKYIGIDYWEYLGSDDFIQKMYFPGKTYNNSIVNSKDSRLLPNLAAVINFIGEEAGGTTYNNETSYDLPIKSLSEVIDKHISSAASGTIKINTNNELDFNSNLAMLKKIYTSKGYNTPTNTVDNSYIDYGENDEQSFNHASFIDSINKSVHEGTEYKTLTEDDDSIMSAKAIMKLFNYNNTAIANLDSQIKKALNIEDFTDEKGDYAITATNFDSLVEGVNKLLSSEVSLLGIQSFGGIINSISGATTYSKNPDIDRVRDNISTIATYSGDIYFYTGNNSFYCENSEDNIYDLEWKDNFVDRADTGRLYLLDRPYYNVWDSNANALKPNPNYLYFNLKDKYLYYYNGLTLVKLNASEFISKANEAITNYSDLSNIAITAVKYDAGNTKDGNTWNSIITDGSVNKPHKTASSGVVDLSDFATKTYVDNATAAVSGGLSSDEISSLKSLASNGTLSKSDIPLYYGYVSTGSETAINYDATNERYDLDVVLNSLKLAYWNNEEWKTLSWNNMKGTKNWKNTLPNYAIDLSNFITYLLEKFIDSEYNIKYATLSGYDANNKAVTNTDSYTFAITSAMPLRSNSYIFDPESAATYTTYPSDDSINKLANELSKNAERAKQHKALSWKSLKSFIDSCSIKLNNESYELDKTGIIDLGNVITTVSMNESDLKLNNGAIDLGNVCTAISYSSLTLKSYEDTNVQSEFKSPNISISSGTYTLPLPSIITEKYGSTLSYSVYNAIEYKQDSSSSDIIYGPIKLSDLVTVYNYDSTSNEYLAYPDTDYSKDENGHILYDSTQWTNLTSDKYSLLTLGALHHFVDGKILKYHSVKDTTISKNTNSSTSSASIVHENTITVFTEPLSLFSLALKNDTATYDKDNAKYPLLWNFRFKANNSSVTISRGAKLPDKKLYKPKNLTWDTNTWYEVSILYDGDGYTLKQVAYDESKFD